MYKSSSLFDHASLIYHDVIISRAKRGYQFIWSMFLEVLSTNCCKSMERLLSLLYKITPVRSSLVWPICMGVTQSTGPLLSFLVIKTLYRLWHVDVLNLIASLQRYQRSKHFSRPKWWNKTCWFWNGKTCKLCSVICIFIYNSK